MAEQFVQTDAGPGVLADFQLSPEFRRPALHRFIMTAAGTAIFTATALASAPLWFLAASVLAVLSAGYGVAYICRGRFRTTVTYEGIDIQGYRHRFVPWHQVARVETTSVVSSGSGPVHVYRRGFVGSSTGSGMAARSGRNARLATITVIRTDGKRVMLRAPLVAAWAWDPYFSAKALQLRQLTSQYSGQP